MSKQVIKSYKCSHSHYPAIYNLWGKRLWGWVLNNWSFERMTDYYLVNLEWVPYEPMKFMVITPSGTKITKLHRNIHMKLGEVVQLWWFYLTSERITS